MSEINKDSLIITLMWLLRDSKKLKKLVQFESNDEGDGLFVNFPTVKLCEEDDGLCVRCDWVYVNLGFDALVTEPEWQDTLWISTPLDSSSETEIIQSFLDYLNSV